MFRLSEIKLLPSRDALKAIPEGKILINTINAHSFNVAQKDVLFAEALLKGDYLCPDGMSIVKACRWLKTPSCPKERIAGWDLFVCEMDKLNKKFETSTPNTQTTKRPTPQKPVCMFVGSTDNVLTLIRQRAATEYPNIQVVTLSPPFKPEFTDEDNRQIINAINNTNPDLLWIGMTAPKQEKWIYSQWQQLNIHCHAGTIGAVFDFYAGTVRRAPEFWQRHSLEWLHRLLSNPRRMWRRYILGNPLFIYYIIREKLKG
ncbi:MAG: WecB/TagA/CpsF family glycosyltransferase [Prevotella sp.]|nr:WecB/TagA/CpsF family glycosyltransferase [Prevotella sp.]